jgi:hypothetical protein
MAMGSKTGVSPTARHGAGFGGIRNIDLVASELSAIPGGVAKKPQAAKYLRLPTPHRPKLFQAAKTCC